MLEFIPRTDRVMDFSDSVPRKMTNVFRRGPELRDSDGAVAWEKLVIHFRMFPGEQDSWSSQRWIACLRKGSTKTRCEYCLTSHGKIQYM